MECHNGSTDDPEDWDRDDDDFKIRKWHMSYLLMQHFLEQCHFLHTSLCLKKPHLIFQRLSAKPTAEGASQQEGLQCVSSN